MCLFYLPVVYLIMLLAVQIIYCQMVRRLMCNELERVWRKWSWTKLRHHPRVWLEGLKNTTRNLSQVSWSLGQELKLIWSKSTNHLTMEFVVLCKLHVTHNPIYIFHGIFTVKHVPNNLLSFVSKHLCKNMEQQEEKGQRCDILKLLNQNFKTSCQNKQSMNCFHIHLTGEIKLLTAQSQTTKI
jgi:hypothetical protein